MVLFALSFQGQVEKYGVYVGIAAFFGLAVLSLLYFSQARELKRLREWAGRAPERAQELEQRVVAQAAAGVARRAPAMPGTAAAKGAIAPPRRLAEMPTPPPGAQTAAGAQATELAEAVDETAEPTTNGNVPAPPAGAEAGAADGTPPEEEADGVATDAGDGETPDGKAAEASEEEAAAPAAPAPATAGADEAAEPSAPGGPDDEATAGEAAGPPAPSADELAPAVPPADEEPEPTPAARPGEVPAAVPRATPAQRVGVTPRPAPMPLRKPQPSAMPSGRGGARRPGATAGRRPAGTPREGRSAGTIALFVGIAVLILGGGTFVISQLGGDDSPPAPNRETPAPNQTATGTGDGGSGETATAAADTNVAVLNGTTFTGLAGQIADRVSQEGGYERGITETNTRDQTIQASTVLYVDGFRSQARDVAELLSISAVEPIDEETQALAPDADVVVLAGADQAP